MVKHSAMYGHGRRIGEAAIAATGPLGELALGGARGCVAIVYATFATTARSDQHGRCARQSQDPSRARRRRATRFITGQ
jgi:hypothetical protein